MARSPNCTGAPLYKGRVDVSITYPDPDIQTLDTPEALPTSEPATAQVSMTVASSHLTTWSPFELEHIDCAILYAAGQNTSGSAITVYCRVEKNGAFIATGAGSVQAGDFYTWSHSRFPEAQIGDVLTCKLWASASGCDWRKKALAIWPSRIGPKGQPIAELVFHSIILRSVGTPASANSVLLYPAISGSPASQITTSGVRIALWLSNSVYGLGAVYAGDASRTSAMRSSAWPEFSTTVNYAITRLSYTPLNLRV